ncbi:hypothetical protein HDU82_002187 [Entophlyctis luteolus]|nr:hypothetical protein HDU82_002187 [Entophlyctis luteolus]
MPFRKADIHVMLYESIPGLGVRVGMARNYLIPFKLAYYVPRAKGIPILPKNWERKTAFDKNAIKSVLPAFFDPAAMVSPAPSSLGWSASSARKASTPEQIEGASALAKVTELEFKLPLIDPKGRRTFGSVTVEDIIAKLREAHGVTSLAKDDVVVLGMGGRIKEIGEHPITVRTPTGSLINITVKVNPE